MSIASEISRLQTAKTDIKTAIEAKGVTVPSSATIDTYDDYVAEISGGGSSADTEALINLIERDITYIDIPTGVTSIGVYAFYYCTSLSGITIPNSVTSIGFFAFANCTSLTGITIPDSVTSIEGYVLAGCSSLTSITVEAVTPPALESGAFNGTNDCPIYVPCSAVSAYRSASGWSDYASRIHGIPPCEEPTKWVATFTGGTTASAECDSSSAITSGEVSSDVVSIQIGDCVTSIGYGAFDSCSSLSSVTIPDSVTSISNEAFWACTGLISVTIPDSVTSIGPSAFQNCSGLTSVTIGNGVTSLEGFAFYGCSSLSSVIVEATTPPALGSWAFNSTGDCPIYVPSESVETYKAKSGWSSYASRIQAIP